MSEFESKWEEYKSKVEVFLEDYLGKRLENKVEGTDSYMDAIRYGTMGGGKRFRPVLAMLTAECLEVNVDEVVPYAAAVEMIHCFSLIHDDLPCMDDDDFRRGKPTVHKKFGEATALLAGDGMIVEAVQILLQSYGHKPELCIQLVNCLMDATGSFGMIAGQVIDLNAQKEKIDIAELEQVHLHKTGALIRCSADGAALVANAKPEIRESIREYSELLGLCFQIKDDLLEVEDNKIEQGSYPGLIGVVASNKLLMDNAEHAHNLLEALPYKTDLLQEMIRFNSHRSN